MNILQMHSSLQYGTVADWVGALATLAAFIVAIGAYASWKRQHRSKAEEKLAHDIVKAVYRLQDLIEDAKGPGFSTADLDAWHEKYREQSSELRSLIHESYIYWGSMLRDIAKRFWEARVEVTLALKHRQHDDQTNNRDALFTQKDNDILWDEAHNKKIRSLVREFEALLKGKHIR